MLRRDCLAFGCGTIAKSARHPVILSTAKNLHPCGETLRCAQGDNYRHFAVVLYSGRSRLDSFCRFTTSFPGNRESNGLKYGLIAPK